MSIFVYSFAVLMFVINGITDNPDKQGSVKTNSLVLRSNIQVQDIPPTTSLVYPGTDGRLVYVTDSLGNKIPDFSNAGYKGGGVPIPYVAIKATVWPVKGDNSANIQAAIDRVSSLPADPSGFRGAVLLKMGLYELESPLFIRTSGVVLRGEGMSDTGTILVGVIPKTTAGSRGQRQALINISGTSGATPNEETKQIILINMYRLVHSVLMWYLPKAFKAGDKVLVRRIGNQDFIKAIGEDSIGAGRNRWRPFNITWDRVIKEVKGNTITIDAPILCAIEARWGGGEILKYDGKGRIEQAGIENLRGISDYNPAVRTTSYGNMDRGNFDDKTRLHYEGDEYYSDENHYYNFINLTNAVNSWVRNISGLHFASSVVSAGNGTKWITVQDCESREPVSIRAGARRFTLYVKRSAFTCSKVLFTKRETLICIGHKCHR